MGWGWTLHTHYATGGAVEILTLVFEGFGERGFGGEGEVSGGGRHGGGGQMYQLREWLLLLQAMVGYCCCWSGGGGGKWKYSEASDEVRRREVGNVWLLRNLFLTTHTTY